MRKLCLLAISFFSLFFFILAPYPSFAFQPSGTSCPNLPSVPITVNPASGGLKTPFKVTVHWSALKDNPDALKAWAQFPNYKVSIPDALERASHSFNGQPTDDTIDFINIAPQNATPTLQVHFGPGANDDGCEGYEASPVQITYDVNTIPTTGPTPTAAPKCEKDGWFGCWRDSECTNSRNPACTGLQLVCQGASLSAGKPGRCVNSSPSPTPTPIPGELKYGDPCNINKASGGIAAFTCPSDAQCQVTDPSTGNGICGGPEAGAIAPRCNTSVNIKLVDVCYPYTNESTGTTTDKTLSNVIKCGEASAGFVCKDPQAYLCLSHKTDNPTAADLKCQVIPPAKSPCLEGLMEDGRPAPTDKPALIAKCTKFATAVGNIQTTPMAFLQKLFGIILSLAGGIALLLIIYSGYQILTSQGNPEKVQGAKDTITSAIIGLVFMIFSMLVLQVIGVDILHIPIFNGQATVSTAPKPTPTP